MTPEQFRKKVADDTARIFGEKDIWRQMASRILNKPEAEVTREERRNVKHVFFITLHYVAELPENEHLARALSFQEPDV
jgi:hypothetical protein